MGTALALNVPNIIGYFGLGGGAGIRVAHARQAREKLLTCEQTHQLALWGKDRYRESGAVRLDASDFRRSAVEGFFEKLDVHRLLFLAKEAETFQSAAEKAWPKWMAEKRCDVFEDWITKNYPAAVTRFHKRLTLIDVAKSFPKSLPKAFSTEPPGRPPKFKTFAKDEAELTERLTQWTKWIAAQSTQSLLLAYGGEPQALVRDTLEQLLFEFKPDPEALLAKAVLAAMDPYSTYFSPLEFEDFYFDLAGGTSGIGIRVRKVPAGLLVEKVIAGSAADRSKRLKEGNIITAVDGIKISNLGPTAAKHTLKGPELSTVRLRVLSSAGSTHSYQLTLKRRHFSFDDARITRKTMQPAKPGVGPVAVIAIPSFYGRGGMGAVEEERSSAEDLKQALHETLAAKKKPSAVVLDLRDNPGGFLEEAVTMAGYFLEGNPVVEVVEPDGRRVLRPESRKPIYSGPLFVLVDEGTASASEVLAGALKDYQRAIVVGGKRTYGKGSVQKLFHLDDELLQTGVGISLGKGVVKLTTSVFYSPLGHTPANGGIVPHISLPMTATEDDLAAAPRRAIPEQKPFLDDSSIIQLKERQEALQPRLSALESLSRKRTIDVREEMKAIDAEDDGQWEVDEAVSIALDYVSLDQSVATKTTSSR